MNASKTDKEGNLTSSTHSSRGNCLSQDHQITIDSVYTCSVWSTIVSGNRRRFRTCELARGVQNLRVLFLRVTSTAHLVFRHTGVNH